MCLTCKPNTGVASARFGDYKIIMNGDKPCSMRGKNDVHAAWPELGNTPVKFGLTSGYVLKGTHMHLTCI